MWGNTQMRADEIGLCCVGILKPWVKNEINKRNHTKEKKGEKVLLLFWPFSCPLPGFYGNRAGRWPRFTDRSDPPKKRKIKISEHEAPAEIKPRRVLWGEIEIRNIWAEMATAHNWDVKIASPPMSPVRRTVCIAKHPEDDGGKGADVCLTQNV